MSEKIQAIVFKSSDKKEKDKSVLLFSIEKGMVWATLKGVRGPNAKMKLAQNPFCFGEFIMEEGKSGTIVVGFEAIETFHEISEDIDKYFEATSILEVVKNIKFSSEQEQAKVFVLTLKSLKAICFGKIRQTYVLNKFFLELFKLSGFPLYTEKCTCCGTTTFDKLYINYSIGELLCSACKTFNCDEISKTTYMALKILNNTEFEMLNTIKLAETSEMSLLRVLVKNYESHFDKSLNLMGILS